MTAPAAASTTQPRQLVSPLSKYKLVFLGDQVRLAASENPFADRPFAGAREPATRV